MTPLITNRRELFTYFLIAGLSIHVSIEMIVHNILVNFHCMLFGQVFEKKRIFVDGFVPLCRMFFFTELFMVVLGLWLFFKTYSQPSYCWTNSSKMRKCCRVLIVYLIVLYSLFLKGFHSLCNSLDAAPVCNSLSIRYIEWKYFEQKYLDGSKFFPQYVRMAISSWLSVGSFSYGFLLNSKKGSPSE